MKILLQRDILTTECTMGQLSVDERPYCVTLEDPMREILMGTGEGYYWTKDCKVPGKTAIPAGTYEVVVSCSARFGRLLPLLLKVPDFDGVRMHGGNTALDTEGCILLARNRDVSRGVVWDCDTAVVGLTLAIQQRSSKEKVFIEVRNP